jgi:hypothetical protein
MQPPIWSESDRSGRSWRKNLCRSEFRKIRLDEFYAALPGTIVSFLFYRAEMDAPNFARNCFRQIGYELDAPHAHKWPYSLLHMLKDRQRRYAVASQTGGQCDESLRHY